MSTATEERIRDRIITVIAALTPEKLAADRFIAYRNEGAGDFTDWAEANPAAAFRRFSVRDTGNFDTPRVSNLDVEAREVELQIVVAYPQSHRAGIANALDRDDLMLSDALKIERAVGMAGRANFVDPYPNAAWLSGSIRRLSMPESGVDFMLIQQRMVFYRSFT